MYSLRVEKPAEKFILKLDRPTAKRFRDAIDSLVEDPTLGKELNNHETARSYRVGQYRILYDIYESELIVCIIKVGPRGDVYN